MREREYCGCSRAAAMCVYYQRCPDCIMVKAFEPHRVDAGKRFIDLVQ